MAWRSAFTAPKGRCCATEPSSSAKANPINSIVWCATTLFKRRRTAPLATMSLLDFNGSASPLPEVRLRFTDLSMPADTRERRQLLNSGGGPNIVSLLSLQDCQWRGLYHDGRASQANLMTISLVNNLIVRGTLSFAQDPSSGYQPFTLNCY